MTNSSATPPPLMPDDTSRMIRKFFIGLGIVVGLIGAVSVFYFITRQQDTAHRQLPTFGVVPPFSFTDQDNRTFSRDSLHGKIWVGDLIFTTCEGVCPIITGEMSNLAQKYADRGVRFISISVDPAKDSVAALKAYAKEQNADIPNWRFLTGSVPTIYTLIKEGFHLPLDSVGGTDGSPIIHSQRMVLVDNDGIIRGYYDATDTTEVRKLTDDIQVLISQQSLKL